jgi:TorA maturation chaperone TorD
MNTRPDTQLLAQADLLLLLADLLRPPAQARSRLASVRAEDVAPLVAATGLDDATRIQQSLAAAWSAYEVTSPDNWSDEYHRLFEGATVCPLNETAWIRRDKGAILGDLAGYYRAFGWAPDQSTGEKPDHLLTELEFAAVLLVMQAQAPAESANVTAEALGSFAANHLHDWLGEACGMIEAASGLAVLKLAAATTRMVWEAMVRRHNWPVTFAPPAMAPQPDAEEGRYECGMANAAPIPLLRAGRPAEPLEQSHAVGAGGLNVQNLVQTGDAEDLGDLRGDVDEAQVPAEVPQVLVQLNHHSQRR